jgi:HPt (histidine-containing phosphotransfer) domain-containing protein
VENQSAPLDWMVLKKLCLEDEGLAREMLEAFVKENREQVDGVRKAVRARDSVALKVAAGRLKTTLKGISAEPAAHMAERLEQMGTTRVFEGIDRAWFRLTAELGRLDSVLHDLTQPNPLEATG